MHICANLVRQNVDDQGCIKAWKRWTRQRICFMYSRPLIDWPFGIISEFCHSFTLYNNKGFQSSWPHHLSQSHAWWSLKLIIMIMTITMVWHPTLWVPHPEEDCQVRVTVSFLSLLWLQTSALITLWITLKKPCTFGHMGIYYIISHHVGHYYFSQYWHTSTTCYQIVKGLILLNTSRLLKLWSSLRISVSHKYSAYSLVSNHNVECIEWCTYVYIFT